MTIAISQSQALKRWETLPEELREALYSEKFSAILWGACKNAHLSEEKTREVAKVVGYVLLGFLHPEDAASEIRERLQIDGRLAATLADEFSKKIFASYRDTLHEFYAPPAQEGSVSVAPKLIDIAPVKPIVTQSTPKEPAPFMIRPEEEKKPFIPSTMKKPQLLPPMPSEKKSLLETPVPPPTLHITISAEKEGSAPENVPPPAPSPFILHEEARSTPVSKPQEFKFTLGREFFEKNRLAPAAPPPPPSKPARIELGATPREQKQSAPPIARTEKPTGRIVHYSDLRTPLSSGNNSPFEPLKIDAKTPSVPFVPSATPIVKHAPQIPTPPARKMSLPPVPKAPASPSSGLVPPPTTRITPPPISRHVISPISPQAEKPRTLASPYRMPETDKKESVPATHNKAMAPISPQPTRASSPPAVPVVHTPQKFEPPRNFSAKIALDDAPGNTSKKMNPPDARNETDIPSNIQTPTSSSRAKETPQSTRRLPITEKPIAEKPRTIFRKLNVQERSADTEHARDTGINTTKTVTDTNIPPNLPTT